MSWTAWIPLAIQHSGRNIPLLLYLPPFLPPVFPEMDFETLGGGALPHLLSPWCDINSEYYRVTSAPVSPSEHTPPEHLSLAWGQAHGTQDLFSGSSL